MSAEIINFILHLVTACCCIALSGVAESIMDVLQFHYSQSYFSKLPNQQFWNPVVSWKNKYRDGDPLKGPRFLGSTTMLVAFTDAWHLFKLLRNTLAVLSSFLLLSAFITWHWALIYAISFRVVYGVYFTISYRVFKKTSMF
jgi:hypothetical protein